MEVDKITQIGLTSPFRQPRQYLTPTAWELKILFFEMNFSQCPYLKTLSVQVFPLTFYLLFNILLNYGPYLEVISTQHGM